MHRGRVTGASDQPGGVRVHVDDGGSATELSAGWLINCSGPGTDITVAADPLGRDLLDQGLVRPDRLRLGLDADSHGALREAGGRPASDIFTLGPTLRGHWYETTAIPEIRDQAAALARRLVSSRAQAGPGSAAQPAAGACGLTERSAGRRRGRDRDRAGRSGDLGRRRLRRPHPAVAPGQSGAADRGREA